MPALAARLSGVEVSASVVMAQKARALAAAGHRVIALNTGEPDFPTPPHAIEAAHQAALRGETRYPPYDGTKALKEAVRKKFLRDNNLDYAADEVMVCNGGKQVIYNALMATVDQGDEVVIPSPFWVSYADMAKLAGGVPVLVNCPQNNGFRLRPEDLDAAITPRSKWLFLNFPNNPTGATCPRDQMRAIADAMLRHPHVWILTDDIYESLIYSDEPFCTIAEVEPRLRDRTVTLNGASKIYAMTGWRVGYCGAPRALIKAMINVQGQATSGVSTISQAAALAALEGPQDFVAERREAFRRRRDLCFEILSRAPGLSVHRPDGAFYLFPGIAGCLGKTSAGGARIATDTDFVAALLEEKRVSVVQGAAYGMSPHVRLSTASDDDTLREGCTRIVDFCASLT